MLEGFAPPPCKYYVPANPDWNNKEPTLTNRTLAASSTQEPRRLFLKLPELTRSFTKMPNFSNEIFNSRHYDAETVKREWLIFAQKQALVKDTFAQNERMKNTAR